MDAQPNPNPTPRTGASGSATGPAAGAGPRMADIPPACSSPASSSGGDGTHAENPATSAAKSIPKYLAELKAYATYFLSAKVDGFKATARTIVVYAALGVIGLLVA